MRAKLELDLNDNQIIHSYTILKEFGNMSSATILFVLKEILNNGIKPGEKIIAVGFGPGISVDISLLTYA
ncbi:MAG: hypothetical protein HC906_00410 [Bacteroidales bacterium]|nr:hypothetical protein [Bacteroidales bacterium]